VSSVGGRQANTGSVHFLQFFPGFPAGRNGPPVKFLDQLTAFDTQSLDRGAGCDSALRPSRIDQWLGFFEHPGDSGGVPDGKRTARLVLGPQPGCAGRDGRRGLDRQAGFHAAEASRCAVPGQFQALAAPPTSRPVPGLGSAGDRHHPSGTVCGLPRPVGFSGHIADRDVDPVCHLAGFCRVGVLEPEFPVHLGV